MSGAHPHVVEMASPPSSEWQRLVDRDPDSTYFHRWSWSETYARHHRGEPFFFGCTVDGRLVGGLPAVSFPRGPAHYIESQPMGTYGGPLVDPDFPDRDRVWSALMAAFFARGDRPDCLRSMLVLRRGDDPRLVRDDFIDTPIHCVPLDDGYEGFWHRSFSHSRRKECNRASRQGVVARVNSGDEAVRAYYPLHEEAHARWGLAPHPLAFFLDLLSQEPALAWFVSVHHADRILGAHLSFVSGRELILWHGVTTRENAKGLYPSTMLIRAQAEEATRRGLDMLNLGGSGDNQGIHQQKVLLGGEEAVTATFEREAGAMRLARRFRPAK